MDNAKNTRPCIRGKIIEVKEEWRNSSGTFWKREVVVETGFRYSNPIKVAFQKELAQLVADVQVNDEVSIPYAINGRRWDGPNGTAYYIDIVGLGLTKTGEVAEDTPFEAEAEAAPAAAPAPAPTAAPAASKAAGKKVFGADMAAAINAWRAKHGDDNAGFAKFCRALKGDKGSKDYSLADWGDVVNAIAAEGTATAADEDLPF